MVRKIYKSNKRIKKMKKYTKNKRNKLRKTRIKKRNSRKKQLGGASTLGKSEKATKIFGLIGTNEFDQFDVDGKTYHLEVPKEILSGDSNLWNPITKGATKKWKLIYKNEDGEKKCILKIINYKGYRATNSRSISYEFEEPEGPEDMKSDIFIKVYKCKFIPGKGYYTLMERGDTIKEIGISKEKADKLYDILKKALENIAKMIDLSPPIIWWDVKPDNSVMVGDDLKFIDLHSTFLSKDLGNFKIHGLTDDDDKIKKNMLKLLLQFSYLSLFLRTINKNDAECVDVIKEKIFSDDENVDITLIKLFKKKVFPDFEDIIIYRDIKELNINNEKMISILKDSLGSLRDVTLSTEIENLTAEVAQMEKEDYSDQFNSQNEYRPQELKGKQYLLKKRKNKQKKIKEKIPDALPEIRLSLVKILRDYKFLLLILMADIENEKCKEVFGFLKSNELLKAETELREEIETDEHKSIELKVKYRNFFGIDYSDEKPKALNIIQPLINLINSSLSQDEWNKQIEYKGEQKIEIFIEALSNFTRSFAAEEEEIIKCLNHNHLKLLNSINNFLNTPHTRNTPEANFIERLEHYSVLERPGWPKGKLPQDWEYDLKTTLENYYRYFINKQSL